MNLNAVQDICQQSLFTAVVVSEKIAAGAEGEVWAWPNADDPKAIAWAGANLNPVIPHNLTTEEATQAIEFLVAKARQWGQRCSAITGEAEPTLRFWQALQPYWPRPREIRHRQPLYLLAAAPTKPTLPLAADQSLDEPRNGNIQRYQVKVTSLDELHLLIPAAIAMFTEEIGYSPMRFGFPAYRHHVERLIGDGRSYCIVVGNRVIFKADIGAATGGVALLQGVWVAPDLRGQGIGRIALQQVLHDVQTRLAPKICLYVNPQNSRAIHLYESLGFRQVGEVATILF